VGPWRIGAVALVATGLGLVTYGVVAPGYVRPPLPTAGQDAGSRPSLPPPAAVRAKAPTPVALVSHTSAGGAAGPAAWVRAPLERSAPVTIDIPAVPIASKFGPARGLDSSGAIDDAPLSGPSWSLPWWYDEGSAPGQDGSAVILGHVDSAIGAGGLGVFFHLGDVHLGNSIEVGLADGSITHWVVTSTELYPDATFPDALVYSVSGPPTLRLVTCGGNFDPQTHLYQSALVVTARLVGNS
jgi:hypothetical protein